MLNKIDDVWVWIYISFGQNDRIELASSYLCKSLYAIWMFDYVQVESVCEKKFIQKCLKRCAFLIASLNVLC